MKISIVSIISIWRMIKADIEQILNCKDPEKDLTYLTNFINIFLKLRTEVSVPIFHKL